MPVIIREILEILIFENAVQIYSAYTPVPGGFGPMTISSLIKQAVASVEIYYKI